MKRNPILPALLCSGLAITLASPEGKDPGANALREGIRSYRAAHEAEIVEELTELLALPNVAADTPNIEKNAEAIGAADGPVHQTRRMQIYFGARGVAGVDLTIYGPLRRLHSGHYGNWAPNPIVELAKLISSLRDTEGRILIPGFSDDVRPPTESERRAIAAAPDVDAMMRRELGLGRTEGAGESLLETLMRPAINLRGVSAGDVGARATNSIPTEASASIDFRLVPDQTPEKVREAFEQHVRRQGFTIVAGEPDRETRSRHPRLARLVWGSGYPAARTSMDLPVSRAVARVIQESAGGPLVELPTLGGSVPMYLFSDKLATPVVGVPIVNHDNNQHAANENLRLQNLWDGIETCAALLARLGYAWN